MRNLLMATLVAICVTACSGENKDLLVGTWQEVETGSSIVTYSEDGTFLTNYEDGTLKRGKWRLEGKKLYIKEEGSEEEMESTLTTLDDSNLVENVADMFETKYKRKK